MARWKDRRALTKEELRHAALVCFRSAEELLADAELLDSFKRYPRAIFLACIGIEELGKAALTLELYDADWSFSEANRREFWEFWRHHLSKAAHGDGYIAFNVEALEQLAIDLIPEGHASWKEYVEQQREFYGRRAEALVSVKEASLYVDFMNRGESSGFRLPSRVFREAHSRQLIEVLREKVEGLRTRIKHLGWLNAPPYPPDWEEHAY